MEKNIVSLAEFIEETNALGDSYFRGESEDYGKTKLMSSAYRQLGNGNPEEIIGLREDYFREIGYSLNQKETENFIAYSQHHGLPTELIDITRNSLVALYFACCDSQDKDGFVYVISSNDTINLNKRLIHTDITKQKIDFNLGYKSFKNAMFHENVQVDSSFEKLLLGISENQEEIFAFLNSNALLIKEKLDSANLSLDKDNLLPFDITEGVNTNFNNLFLSRDWSQGISELNVDFYNSIIMNDIRKLYAIFRHKENEKLFSKHFWDLDYYNEAPKRDEAFALLLLALSIDLVINPLGTNSSTGIDDVLSDVKVEFPPIKCLVHRPSVVFDRMQNQQGLFIYQISIEEQRFTGSRYVVQPLKPSQIFRIKQGKKNEILSQLENIGISKKFIYPDHDNIARYISDTWKKNKS